MKNPVPKKRAIKKRPECKPGQIPVRKRDLIDHCNVLRSVLRQMDAIMKTPSNEARGKLIAGQMNRLDHTRFHIERYHLDLPLKKTGYEKEIK